MIVGLRHGWIGEEMTPGERKEAIKELSDDEPLQMVRVVPANAWRGHVPANDGIWGGLL